MIHQYDSKGVTAVVDRCVRIQHTYGNIPLNLTHPWYHSIPKSLICCCSGPRLVHAALAMHAILAALGTIFQAYPALCPCEPRHPLGDMQAVLWRSFQTVVGCSRPPARNLDLSSSDHALGPWVGFILIQLSKLFKNGPGMPKKRPRSLCSLGLASL